MSRIHDVQAQIYQTATVLGAACAAADSLAAASAELRHALARATGDDAVELARLHQAAHMLRRLLVRFIERCDARGATLMVTYKAELASIETEMQPCPTRCARQ